MALQAAFVIVNIVPAEADHSAPTLFISGMIAITAMILPGISGSFMLLIMGQYDYVLTAVSNRDLPPIIIVGLGAAVGIILFSRLLSHLLKHYYNLTVALLVGFMAGSLVEDLPLEGLPGERPRPARRSSAVWWNRMSSQPPIQRTLRSR